MWEAVLRIATPLILGTLGVLLCERVGVLNLGIEGIMTFGAMVGWLTVYSGGDLWVADALIGQVFCAMAVYLSGSACWQLCFAANWSIYSQSNYRCWSCIDFGARKGCVAVCFSSTIRGSKSSLADPP